jgi:hypothetical protein
MHGNQAADRLAPGHGRASLPEHEPRIERTPARMAGLRDAAVVGYLRGRALGDIVQQRGQKDRLALLVGAA